MDIRDEVGEVGMVVEYKLEMLREEVNARFGEVRTDIKELTQALRELIRLDGDIKRLAETTIRLDKVVGEHEKKISALVVGNLKSTVIVGIHERWFWFGMSVVGALVASLLTIVGSKLL